MNAIDELIRDVQAAGIHIRLDPPDLVIAPADLLTPELEERLKASKAEVLHRMELEASVKRLEAAGVCIAVWADGAMRVVVTESETVKAIDDGGTIYSPADMLMYVSLSQHERRMLHSFKKQFGGTTSWRKTE